MEKKLIEIILHWLDLLLIHLLNYIPYHLIFGKLHFINNLISLHFEVFLGDLRA